jgi:hypothetical protein
VSSACAWSVGRSRPQRLDEARAARQRVRPRVLGRVHVAHDVERQPGVEQRVDGGAQRGERTPGEAGARLGVGGAEARAVEHLEAAVARRHEQLAVRPAPRFTSTSAAFGSPCPVRYANDGSCVNGGQ